MVRWGSVATHKGVRVENVVDSAPHLSGITIHRQLDGSHAAPNLIVVHDGRVESYG